MLGDKAERIEAAVDHAAAAVFAAAVAFASLNLLKDWTVQPQLSAYATAAGLVAFLPCARLLRNIAAQSPRFGVPQFDLGTFEPRPEPEELVLTATDRLAPAEAKPADELILDDILAELGPDSRVVRLFDPAAMPTPAQLKDRIDRHLEEGAPPGASPDASQALYDALAELRRSLH